MKILFLDDMVVRQRSAWQWFPEGSDISIAHGPYDGLGLYLLVQSSPKPFDLVSLDRDLGLIHDGEHVVDMILKLHEAMPSLARPKFAIHSWNVPAAHRMEARLRWAGFDVTREVFSPPDYLTSFDDDEAQQDE